MEQDYLSESARFRVDERSAVFREIRVQIQREFAAAGVANPGCNEDLLALETDVLELLNCVELMHDEWTTWSRTELPTVKTRCQRRFCTNWHIARKVTGSYRDGKDEIELRTSPYGATPNDCFRPVSRSNCRPRG